MKRRNSGYTLIEVLLAACLLVFVLAGSAAMALTLVTQEEMNTRIARVQNFEEQLARLYQLGLPWTECRDLVPTEPAVVGTPACTESTILYTTVGFMQRGRWSVTFKPNATTTSWSSGNWVGGDASLNRTRVLDAYRPITP